MTAEIVQRWPKDLPVHPAAELFPLMAGEPFAELVADIKKHGLVEPIVRTENEEILDGRNRLLACVESGKRLRFVTYTGDPWIFAISTNLHRRHLTDTQRAVIAGKLADRSVGRPQAIPSHEANQDGPTRTEAAELLQVSMSAVERARRIQSNGTDSLKHLVDAGKVPLATADRISRNLPPEEQDEFARKVELGINPRVAAQPNPELPPDEPKRKRPKPPRDSGIIGSDALAKLAVEMAGIDAALRSITALDPEATAEECAQWSRDIKKGGTALFRLRKIITSHLGEQP
jgi:ParB-like nuclease family protein